MKVRINFLLSVILFSLAFPNILFTKGFFLFGWVCYVPLFLALKNISIKKSFFYGLLYGFVAFSLLCFWLYRYDLVCGLFSCVYMAVLYAILFFVLKRLEKFFILRAVVFTLFDFFRSLGFLGFEYGIIGYSQFEIPFMRMLGVYNASFVIYLFSSTVAFLLENTKDFSSLKNIKSALFSKKIPIVISCLIILGACFYGGFFKSIEHSSCLKVALVQHNADPYDSGISSYENECKSLIDLTSDALEKNNDVDLVVWSETAVVPDIFYYSSLTPSNSYDERKCAVVENVLSFIKKQKCAFVIGNNYHDKNNLANQYNSALYFKKDFDDLEDDVQIYKKNHLVPFSEYFPFAKFMPHLYNKLIEGGSVFYSPCDELEIFELDNIKFSTPICFEDTFYKVPLKMKKAGVDMIVNLSNDSWSKSISCQNQHVAMACFRSAENRIPSIRSTCSGVTCVINDEGKIISELDSFKQGVLVFDVLVR